MTGDRRPRPPFPSGAAGANLGPAAKLAAAAAVTAAAGLSLAGCGSLPNFRNLTEQRAVRRFGDALTAEDLAALSDATTPAFRAAALDHDAALDDIRLLRLPKEELEVLAVTDVPKADWKDPDRPEALVIVATPPPVKQARFKLVRAEPGRWLVDDVLLKQKKRNVKAVISVTEQLELLAAVRGFTEVWADGTAEQRLAVVTPELRADLSELPADRLDELAGWVVNADRIGTLRPEAQMEEDSAAVRFAGRGYTLLVSLKKTPSGWKVKDAAAENRDGGPTIPSLDRACVAMRGLSTFLDAYAAGDKETLRGVTAPRLYTGSLADADLAAVPLPVSGDLGGESTFRIDGDTAEVVFDRPAPGVGGAAGAGRQVVTVVLTDPHRNDPDRRTGAFLVDEVTLRESDGEQKLLSTVFTARAAVREFVAAAAAADLDGLKMASTRDLSERVWSGVTPADLPGLPLDSAVAGGSILAERYAGTVTEITFDGPAGPRTFVLRDEGGAAKVDDVLAPSFDRPESLKQVCELILPARSFARTLAAGDLPGLQRRSSAGFNRLVWHQLRHVPVAAMTAADHLAGPLASATTLDRGEGARCELQFGTPTNGAVVQLVRQNGTLAVDDVVLTAGVHPDERVALKRVLREQMAEGTLRLATSLVPPKPVPVPEAAPVRDPAVAPAGFTTPAADPFAAPAAVADAADAPGVLRAAVRTAAFERVAEPASEDDEDAKETDAPGSRRKTKAERKAARAAERAAAKAAAKAEADDGPDPSGDAEAPPPFDHPFLFRADAPVTPVKGVDGGTCAPFGGPLPLGG